MQAVLGCVLLALSLVAIVTTPARASAYPKLDTFAQRASGGLVTRVECFPVPGVGEFPDGIRPVDPTLAAEVEAGFAHIESYVLLADGVPAEPDVVHMSGDLCGIFNDSAPPHSRRQVHWLEDHPWALQKLAEAAHALRHEIANLQLATDDESAIECFASQDPRPVVSALALPRRLDPPVLAAMGAAHAAEPSPTYLVRC